METIGCVTTGGNQQVVCQVTGSCGLACGYLDSAANEISQSLNEEAEVLASISNRLRIRQIYRIKQFH
jgi:hypothetical protein